MNNKGCGVSYAVHYLIKNNRCWDIGGELQDAKELFDEKIEFFKCGNKVPKIHISQWLEYGITNNNAEYNLILCDKCSQNVQEASL